MLPTRLLPRRPEDPHAVLAGLCKEMTVNLWLHGAAARHGTRRYGGQSRDTMPLPPLSVAFSAAPGAQRGGTRHASRIVLDAAAHNPASRLFQRPPSVRRNVWTTVGSSMESSNRSMDKAKENPYVVLSGLLLQVILLKSVRRSSCCRMHRTLYTHGSSGQRWEALLQAHDRHQGAAYPYL
ncbi:uncharacterized protein [Triticum aestivum]|uniref:uncharacterized protein n=1 Tax=Triticum aestivum TaxID=4565 RepID=UPI001D02D688|nr:uncharacterized protein LOC123130654 [Triticum aestivum]